MSVTGAVGLPPIMVGYASWPVSRHRASDARPMVLTARWRLDRGEVRPVPSRDAIPRPGVLAAPDLGTPSVPCSIGSGSPATPKLCRSPGVTDRASVPTTRAPGRRDHRVPDGAGRRWCRTTRHPDAGLGRDARRRGTRRVLALARPRFGPRPSHPQPDRPPTGHAHRRTKGKDSEPLSSPLSARFETQYASFDYRRWDR